MTELPAASGAASGPQVGQGLQAPAARALQLILVAALPLAPFRGTLEWPAPGSTAWCSNGRREIKLRVIRVVLTVAHRREVYR